MSEEHRFPELDDDTSSESPEQTAALVAEVQVLAGRTCSTCARQLCGHEAVLSIVLGYKNSARCLTCLAAAMREDTQSLVDRVGQYVRRRDCYRQGWSWANTEEGFADTMEPCCISAFHPSIPASRPAAAARSTAADDNNGVQPRSGHRSDVEFDAGDMGCGDLVLELRIRLRPMPPGHVLHVIARDPGAPADIPAWCGMTGHTLRASHHPDYWIERKSD